MTGTMAASPRTGNGSWWVAMAAIFAYSLFTIATSPLRINGDAALHIEAAERILDGGLPAVDAIDTNPPLIMYLTAGPTAVARAFGAHPAPVFLVFVWVLTAISTFATRHLMLRALPAQESLFANLLGVSLALAWLAVQRHGEYGQREHLFLAGALPFLIVRFRRWEGIPVGAGVAVACGVVGGLAASIKPQLALIVLAPEIFWLITKRTARPLVQKEVAAAAGVAAAYLAFLVIQPEIRAAFFGRWVPLMIQGFAAYNATWEAILLVQANEWRPVGFALLPLAIRAQPLDGAWKLASPLSWSLVTAAGVYILQRKGWSYHALPVEVLAYAIAALGAARLLQYRGLAPNVADDGSCATFGASPRMPHRMPAPVLYAGGAAVAILIAWSLNLIGPATRASARNALTATPMARAITAATAAGDQVMILSTSAWDVYPLLVQLRRHQASRALFTFPVALLYFGSETAQPFPYRGIDGRQAPPEEVRFINDLLADLQRHEPKLVLIDEKKPCYGCPAAFSLSEYFDRVGFIESALSNYERTDDAQRFQVYRRRN